jgi:hypothetical protein
MSAKLPLTWLTIEMSRPNGRPIGAAAAAAVDAVPEDPLPEDAAIRNPSRRWRIARRRPQGEAG